MGRFRSLLATTAATALLITAIGVPAAAADPTDKAALAFVNGIPRKVDVCVNGYEIKSGLKYGKAYARKMKPGYKKIQFRAAKAGRCTGKVLAVKRKTVLAGVDWTVVGTAKSPRKVLIFDNASLPSLAVPSSIAVVRVAADLGEVRIYEQSWKVDSGGNVDPAATTLWNKGDERIRFFEFTRVFEYNATRLTPSVEQLARSALIKPAADHRHEIYLLGSKPANARFVILERATS